MVETKKQTCPCGAVNRWYYKRPAFCLKCKEPFLEETQMKAQFVGNITKKYIPILDKMFDNMPDNTNLEIYPLKDETLFMFWEYGKKRKLVDVRSTPEVFEQNDVNELMDIYGVE